ncbi:2-methoxy-6-polyprenyl-1,4-benzoquinol methylase, mitochondrial isoform X2 [Carlito syrichta]|uniref:2-methoxy-6-polyprenyl-1,4-benzoquinol methylase, mitochondrial isoform X2 n=1 Tax=Carlito syrichta TaxID=1868482 RepID=A0A1U7V224_CARSF|nr:2-methoxy-6-polyprenyl-1,4-benzoquinol methylase, mitochondrial isoform X2 [Carlito syrichta]
MAAARSCALWSCCGRGWSQVTPGRQLPGLRSSWPGDPLGVRLLSQEKKATETHFGFESVSEEEKGGKVYQVFESVAKKYDVMNDVMSLGIHRVWKDLLLSKMRPIPGTKLLDVAGGTGDIAFRFLNYVQAQQQRKKKRQLRAQQNLSWEEIAKKYQNEEDSLGGSHVMVCDINKEMLKVGKKKAIAQGHKAEWRTKRSKGWAMLHFWNHLFHSIACPLSSPNHHDKRTCIGIKCCTVQFSLSCLLLSISNNNAFVKNIMKKS